MGAAISQVKKLSSFKSWLALLIALLCLVAILLTKCRGVVLAITVVMVIYLSYKSFFTSRSKLLKGATVFVYMLGFVAAYFVIQGKFIGVSDQFSSAKMHSIEMRKAHYSNTLVLIKEHLPMGVGLGNFAIQYSQYLNSWIPDKEYSDRIILRNTHSDPLECLAELGPIGLLFVLMIAWIVFIRVDKSTWTKQALWCVLLAQVANSCVNFPFQVIQTQMAVALILGCFIDSKPIGSSWTFSFPKRQLIKIVVTFALLYNGFYHVQRLRAAEQAQTGINYFFAKRPKEAEPYFRKAVELNPRQVDYLMLLAHCLREMGRSTESSSIAENVLGVFPDYLSAYNLIGLNALKINDLNRAVRAFELSYQAQKFQKSTKEKLQLAYFKLGIEFRKRGYVKEARMLEHKLQKIYPDARDSYQREALDLINLKEYDLASSVIAKAKSIANDEKIAYLEARMHVAQSKWVEALEALDRGLKFSPKDQKLLVLKSEIQARFLRKKEPKVQE
jgi:Flp pilus assembly protein TadD